MVSITPIPANPQTTSLNGTEIVPGVQSGTNVKIPVSQIANYTIQQIGVTNPGVLSFNTRTGVVTLTGADITGAGGALLASPAFTGGPTAPTAILGDNTTKLATTAFVASAVAASTTGVATFNTRTGNVTLISADISGAGGALLASPTFTGTPVAPTASLNTSSTQIATTAYVIGQASTSTPLIDGTAAVGTATTWARADHKHPSDTTRLAIAGGTMTGALTISQTLGIVGTTTNNNANAGAIGEYISATQSSPVSISNLTPTNITSISLTAGDWEVDGSVHAVISGGALDIFRCAVSSTTATLPTVGLPGQAFLNFSTGNFSETQLPTGSVRFSLSTTTTVYLVVEVDVVVGSGCVGRGFIQARRVR